MGYIAVGGPLDSLRTGVQNVISSGAAATKILADPKLSEVVVLINEAYTIEQSRPGAKTSGGGSALGDLVVPLKIYVESQRRPWLKWAIPMLILGAPFLLGYAVGSRRKGG